jgi:hypothetical protein
VLSTGPKPAYSGLGLRDSGFVFQVSGFGFRVSGFGFGFWISNFGCRVSGFGFRVTHAHERHSESVEHGGAARIRPRRIARLVKGVGFRVYWDLLGVIEGSILRTRVQGLGTGVQADLQRQTHRVHAQRLLRV